MPTAVPAATRPPVPPHPAERVHQQPVRPAAAAAAPAVGAAAEHGRAAREHVHPGGGADRPAHAATGPDADDPAAVPEPGDPAPDPPPWSPPPEPAPRRGRAVLIAVLTAVVLGAGAATWFLLPDDDPADGGDGGAPTTSEPAPTTPPTAAATAAWLALPRTAATLDDQTLVAPREVEGNVDLYVIDADGTLGARLTTAAEEDVSPVISRDRRNIIYVRELPTGTQLRTVSVDGQGDASAVRPAADRLRGAQPARLEPLGPDAAGAGLLRRPHARRSG